MGYRTAIFDDTKNPWESRGYSQIMDEQEAQRRKKLEELRERGINPYPNDFVPSHRAEDIYQSHEGQDAQALVALDVRYQIAGRMMALRSFGKAAFLNVQDRSGTIQVYLQKNTLSEEQFEIFKKFVEVGDIVGVAGKPMRTRTGELTIHADEFRLLSKNVRPLPEKFHGLRDVEIRYRRRYLDLIVNREVSEVFVLRARILRYLRAFFDGRAFLEVETPMMHPLAGGATARPFTTHHNALDMELYMRVAPELYLKRLLVGGLERVYELNRCFRNEGISTLHNPEFSMLEFYQAYANYQDLMRLTEELLNGLCMEICGESRIMLQEQEIRFETPFARVTVKAAVAKSLAVDEAQLADRSFLLQQAKQAQISIDEDWPSGKLLMALFEGLVEEKLIQPTFVHDFPIEVSPLSRKKDGQEELVDRFELYIAGRELANAFSELNDPDDQKQRFEAQMEAKAQGDEEAMPYDEDYIRALEYGMPPAAGEGIGIDRLVMLFANVPSIRDVILFPLLRPEH